MKSVKKWFEENVTYEGEAYSMDLEQAAAVVDESKNTIVVARAKKRLYIMHKTDNEGFIKYLGYGVEKLDE